MMFGFTYVMIVFRSDVNECADPLLNDCTQTCTNTVGGYTCGCLEGFTKHNATFCKGIYKFVNSVLGSSGEVQKHSYMKKQKYNCKYISSNS